MRLPYYVGGFNDDPAKLIARTQAVYKEMRIETHLFHEVTRVDPERKTVTVRNLDTGAVFEDAYDELMVATGCNSVNPKSPGADRPPSSTSRRWRTACSCTRFSACATSPA